MADTTKIATLVEPPVRKRLAKEYGRGPYHEKKLVLVTGKKVSFDAVSADGSVVASVLSNRARTRTNRANTGGLRKAETDFWRLANIKDKKVRHRLMVFTDQEFCDRVRRLIGDPGTLGVQLEFYELSAHLQKEIACVLGAASAEQKAAGE